MNKKAINIFFFVGIIANVTVGMIFLFHSMFDEIRNTSHLPLALLFIILGLLLSILRPMLIKSFENKGEKKDE